MQSILYPTADDYTHIPDAVLHVLKDYLGQLDAALWLILYNDDKQSLVPTRGPFGAAHRLALPGPVSHLEFFLSALIARNSLS